MIFSRSKIVTKGITSFLHEGRLKKQKRSEEHEETRDAPLKAGSECGGVWKPTIVGGNRINPPNQI
jgi:hypothetical protein